MGKSERFPYSIDTIVHVAKDNKYSLLTLFTICLDVHVAKNNKCILRTVARVTENNMSLRSCRRKQRLEFTDAPYLVGTVVPVAENND